MSQTIDERVVQMKFDNKQFETNIKTTMSSLDKFKKKLDFDGSVGSLKELEKESKKLDFREMNDGIERVKLSFSAMEVFALTALNRISNTVINVGQNLVKAFTIDPVKTGLQEYETQINAIQTILANTQSAGTTLAQVTSALDELNKYADMTIYNFTQMTKNIGTFTAAGIDLDTATQSIKGIANLAAVSGSNAQQASTAMYQLSQALSTGVLKAQDWNSVVNAGMGGKITQDLIKQTAVALGYGDAMNKAIDKNGSFRASLSDGWVTSDILTTAFKVLSGDMSAGQLKAVGFLDDEIDGLLKLGQTAQDAATKVKTFSQLMDTLKEAAQSGWTKSWEYIIGDFEEAKDLLTEVSDTLSGVLNGFSDTRNEKLLWGLASGWKQFLSKGVPDELALIDKYAEVLRDADKPLRDAANEAGEDFVGMYEQAGEILEANNRNMSKSTRELIDAGLLNGSLLKESVNRLAKDYRNLSYEQMNSLGLTEEQVTALLELDVAIQSGQIDMDDFMSRMYYSSGRENLVDALRNSWAALLSVINPVKEAFQEIFPPITGAQIYDLTVKIRDFTEQLILGEDEMKGLKEIVKTILTPIKMVLSVVTSIGSAIGNIGFTILRTTLYGILTIVGNLSGGLNVIGKWILSYVPTIQNFISRLGNIFTTGLGAVFSGLAESLRIIAFYVGNIIALVGKIFTGALSGVIRQIASVAGLALDIGESLTGSFAAINEWLTNKLGSALSWVSANIGNIGHVFETVFSGIAVAVSAAGYGVYQLVAYMSSLVRTFREFIAQQPAFRTAFGWIKNTVSSIVKAVKGLFNGTISVKDIFSGKFDKLTSGLKSMMDKLKGFLLDIKNKVGPVIESGLEYLKYILSFIKDNMFTIVMIGVSLFGAYQLAQFADAIAGFGGILDDVGDAMRRVSKALRNKLNASALKDVGITLLAVSVSLAVVAIAIKTIVDTVTDPNVTPEKMNEALRIVAGMAVVITTLVGILVALDTQLRTVANVKGLKDISFSSNTSGMIGIALMVIGMAGAILMIASAVTKLAAVDDITFKRGLSRMRDIIGYMILALSPFVIMSLVNVFSKGSVFKGLAPAILALVVLIFALKKFGDALEYLDSVKIGWNTIKVLGVMVLALASFASISKLSGITKFRQGLGLAVALTSLSVFMFAMVGVIKLIGMIDDEEVWRAVKVVGAMSAALAALMIIGKVMSTDGNPLKGTSNNSMLQMAALFAGIGGALILLAASLKIIGGMDIPQLAKGLGAISLLIVEIGTLLVVLATVSKTSVDIKGAFGMLMGIASAIFLLSFSMALIGALPIEVLGKATGVIVTLIAAFALVLKSLVAAENAEVKGLDVMVTMLTVAGVLALFAAAMYGVVKAIQSDERSVLLATGVLVAMMLSMSAVCLALAKIVDVVNDKKLNYKTLYGLVGITTVISLLCVGLVALINLVPISDGKTMAVKIAALGAIMLEFVAVVAAIAYLSKVATTSNAKVGNLAILSALTAGIMLACVGILALINAVPINDPSGVILKITALALVLTEFVAVTTAMAYLSKVVTTSKAKVGDLAILSALTAGIMLVCVGVMAILNAIDVPDPANLIAKTSALALLLTEFVAVLTAMAILSKFSAGASLTAADTAVLIILASAVMGLGEVLLYGLTLFDIGDASEVQAKIVMLGEILTEFVVVMAALELLGPGAPLALISAAALFTLLTAVGGIFALAGLLADKTDIMRLMAGGAATYERACKLLGKIVKEFGKVVDSITSIGALDYNIAIATCANLLAFLTAAGGLFALVGAMSSGWEGLDDLVSIGAESYANTIAGVQKIVDAFGNVVASLNDAGMIDTVVAQTVLGGLILFLTGTEGFFAFVGLFDTITLGIVSSFADKGADIMKKAAEKLGDIIGVFIDKIIVHASSGLVTGADNMLSAISSIADVMPLLDEFTSDRMTALDQMVEMVKKLAAADFMEAIAQLIAGYATGEGQANTVADGSWISSRFKTISTVLTEMKDLFSTVGDTSTEIDYAAATSAIKSLVEIIEIMAKADIFEAIAKLLGGGSGSEPLAGTSSAKAKAHRERMGETFENTTGIVDAIAQIVQGLNAVLDNWKPSDADAVTSRLQHFADSASTLFTALDSDIFKSDGLKQWWDGTVKIPADFNDTLSNLAKGVNSFVTEIGDDATFDMIDAVSDGIVTLFNALSSDAFKTDGIKQMVNGEFEISEDFPVFMGRLGNGLSIFSNIAKDIDATSADNATQLLDKLQEADFYAEVTSLTEMAIVLADALKAWGIDSDALLNTTLFIQAVADLCHAFITMSSTDMTAGPNNFNEALGALDINLLVGLVNTINTEAVNVHTAIQNLLEGIISTAKIYIEGDITSSMIGEPFHKIGQTTAEAIAAGLSNKAGDVSDGMTNIATMMETVLTSYFFDGESPSVHLTDMQNKAVNAGYYFVLGFANGVSGNSSLATTAVWNMGVDVRTTFQKALDERSPSKASELMGRYWMMGFHNGIWGEEESTQKVMTEAGNNIVEGFKEAISSTDDLITDEFGNTLTIKPIIDLSDVTDKASILNDMFNGGNYTSSVSANIRGKSGLSSQNNESGRGGDTIYNFNQTNNSPKALSRTEIYRQTKNQLAMAGRIK